MPLPVETQCDKIDLERWKKEMEDVLGLLGSSTDPSHEYPMTKLKHEVDERSQARVSRIKKNVDE